MHVAVVFHPPNSYRHLPRVPVVRFGKDGHILRQRNLLIFLLGLALLAADGAAAVTLWLQTAAAHRLVEETHVVIEHLRSVRANLRGSEGGARGYISTGDRSFLRAYYRASQRLPVILHQLAALLASSPLQQAKLVRLGDLIQQELQWQEQLIGVCDHQGPGKAAALERTHEGLEIDRQIARQLAEMESVESQRLGGREQAFDFARTFLIVALFVLSALGIAFLLKAVLAETKLVRLEEQRKAALDQLETVNRQLNQQVTDLLEARADLGRALSARSQFLANVSHELRTPLSGLIGATELALSMPMSEEQRRLTETARECGQSLLALINDVLDFAKIESCELHLHPAEFDLTGCLTAAFAPLLQKAMLKGLDFNLHIAGEAPKRLVGDSLRLRQVLVNLVDNAIKFTDEGSVTITVCPGAEDSEQVSICFSVSDTGIGIAAADLEVIFDRFIQLDGSLTRCRGGAGLGLAISKRLIDLMGGQIEVTSTPGVGSQFTFTLPFQRAARQAGAAAGPAVIPAAPPGQPRSLLIVDDSELCRTILAEQLRRLGYETTAACNGAEAVQAAKSRPYLLIFMDVQMPVMDGLTATKAIRADKSSHAWRTPIIALTAHALPEHREQCLQAGMNDYLSKPASLSALQDVLERWIGSAKNTRAANVAYLEKRRQQL